MSTDPTAEELANVNLCAQKLWDLDDNRLEPQKDYGLDVQVHTLTVLAVFCVVMTAPAYLFKVVECAEVLVGGKEGRRERGRDHGGWL